MQLGWNTGIRMKDRIKQKAIKMTAPRGIRALATTPGLMKKKLFAMLRRAKSAFCKFTASAFVQYKINQVFIYGI